MLGRMNRLRVPVVSGRPSLRSGREIEQTEKSVRSVKVKEVQRYKRGRRPIKGERPVTDGEGDDEGCVRKTKLK